MKKAVWIVALALFVCASPLSVRFNNPGNLKYYKSNKWIGSIYDENGRFEKFVDKYHGIRALNIVLISNIRKTNSVEEFVNRYAKEPSESLNAEHLLNYRRLLVKVLGYSGKMREEDLKLIRGVVIFREGGKEALEYYKDFL